MTRIDGFRKPYPTEGKIRKTLYNAADGFLNASTRTEGFFNSKIARVERSLKPNNIGSVEKFFRKIQLHALKAAKLFLVKLTDHDYVSFHKVSIPFNKIPGFKNNQLFQKLSQSFNIATPSSGAKLILYYLGLLGPRTHRAWERGKRPDGTHDWSEIKDVLRRDAYAITVFVFGLGALSAAITKAAESWAGVKLFDASKKDAYSYSEQEINAKITNSKVLEMHYRAQVKDFKTAKGFNKALEKGYLSHNIIPSQIREHMTDAQFSELTQLSNKFKSLIGEMEGKSGDALSAHADKAFEPLAKMDQIRETVINKLKKLDASEAKAVEPWIKEWSEYKSFLAQYAKHYRAPLDLASFVIIILSLGYLPVWLNSWFNKKALAAKRASQNKPLAPVTPLKPTFSLPNPSVSNAYPFLNKPAANNQMGYNMPAWHYPQQQVAFSAQQHKH